MTESLLVPPLYIFLYSYDHLHTLDYKVHYSLVFHRFPCLFFLPYSPSHTIVLLLYSLSHSVLLVVDFLPTYTLSYIPFPLYSLSYFICSLPTVHSFPLCIFFYSIVLQSFTVQIFRLLSYSPFHCKFCPLAPTQSQIASTLESLQLHCTFSCYKFSLYYSLFGPFNDIYDIYDMAVPSSQ